MEETDVNKCVDLELSTCSAMHTECLRHLTQTWYKSSKRHSKSSKRRFQMTTVAQVPQAPALRGPSSRLPHSGGLIGAHRRFNRCSMAHVSGWLSGSAAGGRDHGPQSSLNPHLWDPIQPAEQKGHRETYQDTAWKGKDRRLKSTKTSVAPKSCSRTTE